MKQNYLVDYEGVAEYENETFCDLTDNTQLDGIYEITTADNVVYE